MIYIILENNFLRVVIYLMDLDGCVFCLLVQ